MRFMGMMIFIKVKGKRRINQKDKFVTI